MHDDDSPQPVLITGGRVIDPESGRDETADVLLMGGTVEAIGSKLDAPADAERINAEGCLVTPGLIDPHVHLREPGQEHKETIASGTLAAVAGGFTTVCCMPNTAPAIDTPEIVEFIRARAADTAHCRVFPVACGTVGRKGEQIAEIQLCANAGAVGISDDGDVIQSAGMMARVFAATEQAGLAFMQHCQDTTLTRGSAMHAGTVSARLGLGGWPRVAEEIIIERDVRLAAVMPNPCRYHVQHLSSGGSIPIIRRARDAGQPVTAEASPHHLHLTHEACLAEDSHGGEPNAKMNPPLRERSDVEALRAAVAEGVITILATDHAPHSPHEKDQPFEVAPFGIVGLETALALYAEALVETGAIDWPRLIALMTIEPARLCNLDHLGLGSLAEGGPADVTVIDPNAAWSVTPDTFVGKSRNSPFVGWDLKGRPIATIVGGRSVHEAAIVR
ncbi:MAG: dihydroorotase [Planctomycetota bacterium]